MAVVEKLLKALETLRVFQSSIIGEDVATKTKKEPVLSKKDKVASCNTIADCVCSHNIGATADFPKFLGIAMETLITMCDDADVDVRIVADECLNKLIRTQMKSGVGRLQVELYKEIKKNGPSRCVRAALWRFAELAHLILPQKCRPYIVNLLPYLLRISLRPEEMIQETLVAALSKICPVLGGFMNDMETKMLLKAFITNLKSDSVTMRRTAAQCLTLICQYSHRPGTFMVWTLRVLLDTVRMQSSNESEAGKGGNDLAGVTVHTVLGVLLSIRHLMPLLDSTSDCCRRKIIGVRAKSAEPDVYVDLVLTVKVLELLLSFCKHADHNVITAALEALHQLLKHAPLSLRNTLVRRELLNAVTKQQSPGHRRLPSVSEDMTLLEADDSKYDVSVTDVDLSQSCQDVENLVGYSASIDQSAGMVSYQKPSAVGDDTDDDEDSEIFESEKSSTELLTFSTLITADSEYSSIDVGTDLRAEGGLSTSSSNDAMSSAVVCHNADAELKYAQNSDTVDVSRLLPIETPDAVLPFDVTSSVPRIRQGDIGSLTDSNEVPATYLVRLLCSEFLLTGYQCVLMPDRSVRVSVKALALICIACIVDICPRTFIIKMHKSSTETVELQDVMDIIQFTNHSDPQLKGNSAIVIGHFIRAVIGEGNGDWNGWLITNGISTGEKCSLTDLMSHLLGLLSDDSAVAVRLSLTALRLCMPAVFNSCQNVEALKALLALFKLKDNSYWLVKVALLELLADIDYKEVVYLECLGLASFDNSHHHYLSKLDVQQRMLVDVMLKLLGDEDQRVRHASAAAICRVVPNLYYSCDNSANDPVTAKALTYMSANLDATYDDTLQSKSSMTFTSAVRPFDEIQCASSPSSLLDASLSRVITIVVQTLVQSTSRYATVGCCHTLSLLSETYSVIKHSSVWGCCQMASSPLNTSGLSTPAPIKVGRSLSGGSSTSLTEDQLMKCGISGGGPLGLIMSLLISSPVSLDLSAHIDLLQLAGSLFAGAAYKCLRSTEDVTSVASEEQRWPALSDRLLAVMAEQLMTHLTRLLNIFSHIIDEASPGPPPSKPTLPSLPNAPSLSPITRKSLKGGGKEDSAAAQGTPVKDKSTGRTSLRDSLGKDTDSGKDARNRKEGLGLFYTLPHYMKIYEVLKGAYTNYKISLDLSSQAEKFSQILQMTLQSMAQLLEVACLGDVGKHADELLGYLGTTIGPEPTETILCVQQLLKAIFGSNLVGHWESQTYLSSSPRKLSTGKAVTRSATVNAKSGIYHICLNQPYVQFTQSLGNATGKTASSHAVPMGSLAGSEQDESPGLISWLRKRTEKKPVSGGKQLSKTASVTAVDKNSVASYIRLFEPLVIKSLKQYTVTSQVALQQRVLDLLAQLVQLRVNYCLLDSDQIFIGYVIKQFEYIEEGQMRNSAQLIPHIFNFLVLLSYERYHTKTIMQIPKIIQLCDGIMASEQDPATHAIPALHSIVYDLFFVRVANKANLSKDLETQQEVVISMLLRLLQYCQILDLLVIVLHQCRKESEDRWKRLSRQVVDLLLPMLAQLQVNIDGQAGLNTVHRLMECVAPSVFRPIDILLKVLFAKPPKLANEVYVERWVALVIVSLRVVLTQSKEEAVLGRLQQLGLSLCLAESLTPRDHDMPTGFLPKADVRASNSPEEIFASFLLQVISIVAFEISSSAFHWLPPSAGTSRLHFLSVELSHLLFYVMHMFQSGICRRIAVATMSLLNQCGSVSTVEQVNSMFHVISIRWPTLMVQWSNILILLNYGNKACWSDLLQTPQNFSDSISNKCNNPRVHDGVISAGTLRCLSVNAEIVRRGSLILFCDYVCENLSDAEHMTWLIINHVFDLIFLMTEPPIQDFMSAVHRNPSASGLFVQAVHSRSEYISKFQPVLLQRTLQCLSEVHIAQSGALVSLIVECFLDTHHLTLARLADSLACRRVELMVADSGEDGMSQVSIEDINKMLHFLSRHQLIDRHSRLATLLYKLRSALSAEMQMTSSLADKSCQMSLTAGEITDVNINKEWYVSLVSELCCRYHVDARHCAHLLQHLDYTNILAVIMHKNCHQSVLSECILLGTRRTARSYSGRSPMSPMGPSQHFEVFEPGALDPLLRAVELTILRRINSIINALPVPHQVLHYRSGKGGSRYQEYVDELFLDQHHFHNIFHLSSALHSYLISLDALPWKREIPSESMRDIIRFATLALEALYWMISHDRLVSSNHMLVTLRCYSLVVYNHHLFQLLSERDQTTLVCSAILTMHSLVYSLMVVPGDKLVRLPDHESQDDLPNSSFDDGHHAIRACDQISELIDCLETSLNPQCQQLVALPMYLVDSLKSVITGLARLPLVNSYARTPPAVWKLGWMPSPAGDMRTKLPPLPLEYLREKDILSDFIRRVNCLGWTSRQQFEETWMSLLGVLNPLPMDSSQNLMSPDELSERSQCQVLAIGAITALLMQTILIPQSGSPGNSQYECRPRNKPLAFFTTKYGRRLSEVRTIIQSELRQTVELQTESSDSCSHNLLLDNVEHLEGSSGSLYQLGQLSTESIWMRLGLLDSIASPALHSPSSDSGASSSDTPTSQSTAARSPVRSKVLPFGTTNLAQSRSAQRCDLDIHSCLQLLLDVYGNTIFSTMNAPIAVLNETIRSVVVLSDVFTDKSQFEWMLTMLLDIHKSHPTEDELVMQYLIVGVCKAAAVVGVDASLIDRIFKFIDTSLKSTHLSTKISALSGCLYLLETGIVDVVHGLIPLLTDFLLRSLSSITPLTIHSQQHALVMWSVAFFIAENCVHEIRETEFTSKLLQLCLSVMSMDEEATSIAVYLAVTRSLERLILSDSMSDKPQFDSRTIDAVVKLSIDRLCQPNPQRSLAALGMFVTCMYSGLAGSQLAVTGDAIDRSPDSSKYASHNPEELIIAMERVTVLFDRIRKGFPYEARVITRILPAFLTDFCPPQEIMNKVISEFLSSQQPHPDLMANVLFQVFESLIDAKQTKLVNNWVILSLSNFTQRTPLAMAVWSLTCFFISASTNKWLRALMPLAVSRVGRLELVDSQLFYVSARDFYSQLSYDQSHQRAFRSTFHVVAQPDTPYADILSFCDVSD